MSLFAVCVVWVVGEVALFALAAVVYAWESRQKRDNRSRGHLRGIR